MFDCLASLEASARAKNLSSRSRQWNLWTHGIQGKAEKVNHAKGKNGVESQ